MADDSPANFYGSIPPSVFRLARNSRCQLCSPPSSTDTSAKALHKPLLSRGNNVGVKRIALQCLVPCTAFPRSMLAMSRPTWRKCCADFSCNPGPTTRSPAACFRPGSQGRAVVVTQPPAHGRLLDWPRRVHGACEAM